MDKNGDAKVNKILGRASQIKPGSTSSLEKKK